MSDRPREPQFPRRGLGDFTSIAAGSRRHCDSRVRDSRSRYPGVHESRSRPPPRRSIASILSRMQVMDRGGWSSGLAVGRLGNVPPEAGTSSGAKLGDQARVTRELETSLVVVRPVMGAT
jgi:hypothetical protein